MTQWSMIGTYATPAVLKGRLELYATHELVEVHKGTVRVEFTVASGAVGRSSHPEAFPSRASAPATAGLSKIIAKPPTSRLRRIVGVA